MPVRVFCAVTVTPGSGMLPLFTTPCNLPPAIASAGFDGLAGTIEDGEAGGVEGGTVVCPHAEMPVTMTLAATVHRVAARRMDSPRVFVLVLIQTSD